MHLSVKIETAVARNDKIEFNLRAVQVALVVRGSWIYAKKKKKKRIEAIDLHKEKLHREQKYFNDNQYHGIGRGEYVGFKDSKMICYHKYFYAKKAIKAFVSLMRV